ncbi:MFS transporter [soil metagenome]
MRNVPQPQGLALLVGSQSFSQAADGLAQAAFASVLVLDALDQGVPTRILGLLALTLIPYSLIGPFAGVFVDRLERRRLLVWTNVVRAAVLLAFPLWSTLLPGEIPLYAGILTVLGLGRLWLTTKSAVLPLLIPEDGLLRVNALSSGCGMISALIGGAGGIALTGWMGADRALAAAGLLYLGAAGGSWLLQLPPGPQLGVKEPLVRAAAEVATQLRTGVAQVWTHLRARLPLVAIFMSRTVAMFIAIVAILVIKREFPGADGRTGRLSAGALSLGAAGVGAFLGTLTAGFLGRRMSKPALMLVGFGVSGIGIVALGGVPSLVAVAFFTGIAGYGSFIIKVAVDAQLQQVLANAFHGRAFSLYDILYNLASVLAGIIVVVFEGAPLRSLVLLAGLATLLLTVALGIAMQRAGMFSAPGHAPLIESQG